MFFIQTRHPVLIFLDMKSNFHANENDGTPMSPSRSVRSSHINDGIPMALCIYFFFNLQEKR